MRTSCWCGRLKPCRRHTRPRNAPWSRHRDRGKQAAFRRVLIERAGNQCEWIENGQRCIATTDLRATHRIPLRQFAPGDPAAYDPENGRLLCGDHDRRTDRHAR